MDVLHVQVYLSCNSGCLSWSFSFSYCQFLRRLLHWTSVKDYFTFNRLILHSALFKASKWIHLLVTAFNVDPLENQTSYNCGCKMDKWKRGKWNLHPLFISWAYYSLFSIVLLLTLRLFGMTDPRTAQKSANIILPFSPCAEILWNGPGRLYFPRCDERELSGPNTTNVVKHLRVWHQAKYAKLMKALSGQKRPVKRCAPTSTLGEPWVEGRYMSSGQRRKKACIKVLQNLLVPNTYLSISSTKSFANIRAYWIRDSSSQTPKETFSHFWRNCWKRSRRRL